MGTLVPREGFEHSSKEAPPDASTRLIDETSREPQPVNDVACDKPKDKSSPQEAAGCDQGQQSALKTDTLEAQVKAALEILRQTTKEIASDIGAGTVGLAVKTAVGRNPLALAVGVIAGGATKYGLSCALESQDTSLARNMLWGGVDTLAFVAGSGAQRLMLNRYEGQLGTAKLTELGLKHVVNAERRAVTREEALRDVVSRVPTAAEYANANEWRVQEIVVLLQTRKDSIKRILDPCLTREERGSLSRMTSLQGTENDRAVLHNVQERFASQTNDLEHLFKKEFENKSDFEKELATALGDKKGLEGLRAMASVLEKNSESLSLYSQLGLAERQSLALRGRNASFLNPFLGLDPIENYTTLANLQSRIFWKQYGVNAASIGATSLVYNGAHEGAYVGETNPDTGEKYSIYDAVVSTSANVVLDAVVGPFLVANLRSTAADVFTVRNPAYQKVGDAFGRFQSWVGTSSRAASTANSVGTSFKLSTPMLLGLALDLQNISKLEQWLDAAETLP